MEMKQIITATVAVILICLVAIPLIDNSTGTIHTTTQNTTQKYYATEAGELTEDLTITLVSDNNYTINGESYPAPLNSIIMVTDNDFWVLYGNNYNLYQGNTQRSLMIGGSTTFHTDGTYKATTSTGTEYTGTFTNLIYPSINGNLGYFVNKTAYADDDSDVIFFSISGSNGAIFAVKYKASGEFVENVHAPFITGTGAQTMTDSAIVYNTNDETIADRAIKGLTYKIGDTQYTTTSFIAPLNYETITQNDATIITILDLIPVLLIAALIVGIGYSIARRE